MPEASKEGGKKEKNSSSENYELKGQEDSGGWSERSEA